MEYIFFLCFKIPFYTYFQIGDKVLDQLFGRFENPKLLRLVFSLIKLSELIVFSA